jgi:hypothetical protein
MINFKYSYVVALWIAQRINKCDCVRNFVAEEYSVPESIIDYALALPYDHGCKYKDFICIHNYSYISCSQCYDNSWCKYLNQPERSKREDLENRCPEWGNCRTLKYDPRMRCSEHCGNTVRDK